MSTSSKYGSTPSMSLMPQISNPPRHPWRPEAPPSLAGVDNVYFDVESTSLRWWDRTTQPVGIAIAWRVPGGERRSQYLPFRHAGGNLPEERVRDWVKGELAGKRLVGSKTGYDVHVMNNWDTDLEQLGCRIGCVGQQGALLDDSRRRYGLDVQARQHLGRGKIELPKGMIENMAAAHAGEVQAYACRDVELPMDLEEIFFPMLAEQGLHRVRELEEECIYPTCYMERQGVHLDVELLEKWCNESEVIVQKLLNDLVKELGFKPEPKSSAFLSRAFKSLGIVNNYRTAGGETGEQKESFADAVLETFDHPTIKKIRLVRAYISLREKFLLNYRSKVDGNGLLRYALHQTNTEDGGTVSGRYSSSGLTKGSHGEGVNIQQVAKPSKQKLKKLLTLEMMKLCPYLKMFQVRDLFIPPKGKRYIKSDAKQVEYRLFAHFSKSTKILEAYRRDPETDFHNLVWAMLLEIKSDMTRDKTKDLNFAKIFAAGLDKIALMMRCTREEAAPFVAAYDARFPEAKATLSKASNLAKEQGYVKTILGRRARFPGAQFLHKALNRIIQGSNADIQKIKTIELYHAQKSIGLNLRFPLHDEFDGDAEDENTETKMREILDRQSVKLRVPILWDVATGPNWGACK